MKKAVRFSIISWLLTVVSVAPASLLCLAPSVVEGSPVLASITGTVKDEGGTPLAGAAVELLEFGFGGKAVKSMKTNEQGKFMASVTPGSYRLRAEATGFKAQTLTRINLEAAAKFTYNFALKRDDTLVDKRGDRDDVRWIGRSVPRSILRLNEPEIVAENKSAEEKPDQIEDRYTEYRPSFHGTVQFLAGSSARRSGQPSNFFGTNFAISSSLGRNVELALIGQKGMGIGAPQRLAAITSVRPLYNHQITTSIGYGTVEIPRAFRNDDGIIPDSDGPLTLPIPTDITQIVQPGVQLGAQPGPQAVKPRTFNQLSLSAVDSWQVFRPLLIIYGFDYSRFVGPMARDRESLLPRFAVQFTPAAHTRINAAVTPGASDGRYEIESFNTENIRVPFETRSAEVVYGEDPLLDRSRRFEVGIERIFGGGSSSLEVSAFYDVISGHGVGVLALPLEASPETEAAFQQVAHRVAAMNGASRGLRVMYARRLNDYVTASVGYSFGRGERFNRAAIDDLTPARLFTGGFFQVTSAKVDVDLMEQTGTRVSTVVRLSPSAVVFAIDPFAGRMSVYDPNINIYVTQELPSFGLPLRWQAIVDIRNLLDQVNGVEDNTAQIMALRARRAVRGGIAFRW
jgi:hypothetical protein